MGLQYNLICLKLSLLWKRKSVLYNPIVSCLFVWGGVERMVERWWKGFVEVGWKKRDKSLHWMAPFDLSHKYVTPEP